MPWPNGAGTTRIASTFSITVRLDILWKISGVTVMQPVRLPIQLYPVLLAWVLQICLINPPLRVGSRWRRPP
jgi:hypothetical protein